MADEVSALSRNGGRVGLRRASKRRARDPATSARARAASARTLGHLEGSNAARHMATVMANAPFLTAWKAWLTWQRRDALPWLVKNQTALEVRERQQFVAIALEVAPRETGAWQAAQTALAGRASDPRRLGQRLRAWL